MSDSLFIGFIRTQDGDKPKKFFSSWASAVAWTREQNIKLKASSILDYSYYAIERSSDGRQLRTTDNRRRRP